MTDVVTEKNNFSVVDIKSAYRSVNIYPPHRQYQGFVWNIGGETRWLQDNCICFGLKCAPYLFSMLSEFIVRCMRMRGYLKVFSYLDDFIVLGDTYDECQDSQIALIKLLRQLGFFIAWKKVISPSTSVVYLGLELDSVALEVSLPEGKLTKLRGLLVDFSKKDRCTRKELEVLAGHLAHASMVVRGGRTFSRRVINMVKYLSDDVKVCVVPDWLRDDIHWWISFVDIFNGKARMISPADVDLIQVRTDSSMSGFGSVWDNDWLVGVWSLSRLGPGYTFWDVPMSKYIPVLWTNPPIWTVLRDRAN